jgi:hypothetical protein
MTRAGAETSWNSKYFKWLNQQEQDRSGYRLPAQTLEGAGLTDAQQLMLLPLEMMRQHLESVMLRQLEIATGLYSKQAGEFENAFLAHVDRKYR